MSLMPQGSAQSAATSPPARASMSAAAMLLGWRVRIGVWWRIASFTLLSRRITPAEIDGGNHRGIATGSPVGDGEYGGPFHGWLLRSGEEKRCSAKPHRRMIVRH